MASDPPLSPPQGQLLLLQYLVTYNNVYLQDSDRAGSDPHDQWPSLVPTPGAAVTPPVSGDL